MSIFIKALPCIILGILMVGAADFLRKEDTKKNAVLGDVIIVCAQVVAACQFVYEEKFISKYNVHPLKVVGSEGIFGFIILVIAQVGMYFLGDIGFSFGDNPDNRLEDPIGEFQ